MSNSEPEGSIDGVTELLQEFMLRLLTLTGGDSMGYYAEMDMPMPQLRVLFWLSANPAPVPISDVAHALEMTMASAGRHTDALVRAGLVDRIEDRDDRRVKRVSLSSAGFTMLAEEHDCNPNALRGFIGRLTNDQRSDLRAVLTSILAGQFLRGADQESDQRVTA